MFTAQSHPRWAPSKPLALLFVTCLVLPSIGATAGARPSHPSIRARASAISQALKAAGAASTRADHALVAEARALRACQVRHSKHCRATRRSVQRAGHRLAVTERRLSKLARGRSRTTNASAATRAPHLTVSGQTLTWAPVGSVNTYVFVRKVPGQADQYSVITGESITPPPVPGYTVRYSIRTDVNGSAWAHEQSISYPAPTPPNTPPAEPPTITPITPTTPPSTPPTNPQTAPIITVSGQTLTWTQIGSVHTYVLVSKTPGQADQYSAISGTSTTPPVVPGATVHYSVRTAVEGSAWSPEVIIAYPQQPPTTGGGGEGSNVIIGVNNISGWGPEQAQKMITAGIKSERLEYGDYTTIQDSIANGFSNDTVIVGNTPDGSRLSTIDTSSWVSSTLSAVKEEAANGVTIIEVGNEMYLKGGQAEPVKYAEMYMALAKAVDTAGVKGVKLLFNSFGDYQRLDGTYSNVTEGNGWLADALRVQPGLKTRIDDFSQHPYGLAWENNENTDDWGPGALEAEHKQAVELGLSHTDYYVTEFGVQLEAGGVTGSNSQAQQAERIKAVYTELIGTGYVKGIWYYGPHDNETGTWGLVADPWTPRQALAVVASFAS